MNRLEMEMRTRGLVSVDVGVGSLCRNLRARSYAMLQTILANEWTCMVYASTLYKGYLVVSLTKAPIERTNLRITNDRDGGLRRTSDSRGTVAV